MTVKLFRIAFIALFTCIVTTLSAQTVTGNVKDSGGEPIMVPQSRRKAARVVLSLTLTEISPSIFPVGTSW